jgi:glycosyltransferase involved in cell wall biosynthesis
MAAAPPAKTSDGTHIDGPPSAAAAVPPRISVIVPVRNGESTLAVQLEALARQDLAAPWELIVADNGSTDRTVEVARAFASRMDLRIVDASGVRGAGHARNVGARAARAPLLAFVDADDEVAPGWLAAIVDALAEHPVVASRFDKERLNPPDLREKRGLAQDHSLGKHNYAAFLPHAGGSGLAVRRSVHEAIGGFDERLLRLQDTDYSWRLQLAGHAIHLERSALLHVRFRPGGLPSLRQMFDYGRFDGWLYQRYRPHGMERVPLVKDLREIARLIVLVPLSRSGLTRARRLRTLANRLGILIGRLRHPFGGE